ncbi:Thioredoxin-like [bacterium A37T11]|nr:Thioredoxin-like [bacterium A37T11]
MNKYIKWIGCIPFTMISISWVNLYAQSIDFQQSQSGTDWKTILDSAKRVHKLVFVDVYTDWCGPCKLMDDEVFTRNEVSRFFNDHFISYKLDAEKGEGPALKTTYGVKVFPTYLFVDPSSGTLVHKSTSRQTPEVFLFTGRSALNPELRSVWMEDQYLKGAIDKKLLKNYAAYLSSNYQHEKLDTITQQYLHRPEINLTDSLAWHFFVAYQQSSASPEFAYLLQHRQALNKQYGNKNVDAKIASAFETDVQGLVYQGIFRENEFNQPAYDSLMSVIAKLEFAGKDWLLNKTNVLNEFIQKKYSSAADLADQMPTLQGINEKDLLNFYGSLLFLSRNNNDPIWIGRALKYARYIAYNDLDRRSQAEIHYNYASLLEKYFRLTMSSNDVAGYLKTAPANGVKDYTLRSPTLKPKHR